MGPSCGQAYQQGWRIQGRMGEREGSTDAFDKASEAHAVLTV